MSAQDIQLIRAFTGQNDEAAFSAVVEQYLNVAYSAAITCLGSDDLARDVCQQTFIELARRADRLSAETKLGGWVFMTARNIAKQTLRTERRRMKRESKYAEQAERHPAPEPDWSKLAPQIHSAMDKLKPVDREAIILRYFQNKSFTEMGEALNLSADAARMKLNRAVDRLHKHLSRIGITSTAAALAAALPAHAVTTAPAGVAISLSTTTLAGAGAITTSTITSTLVILMKTKTALVITSVVTIAAAGSIYLHAQSAEDIPEQISAEKQLTGQDGQVHQEKSAAANADASTTSPAEPKTAPQKTTQATEYKQGSQPAESSAFQPHPGIDPVAYNLARSRCLMLENAINAGVFDDPEQTFEGRASEDAEKITLRLGLTPEQATEVERILIEDYDARAQRSEKNLKSDLVEKVDMDLVIESYALELMEQPISEELQAYKKSLNRKVGEALGYNPEKAREMRDTPWDKNEGVVDQLNSLMTPEQLTEFDQYLQEIQTREGEKDNYSRTNQIADKLGLNEEDRAALYGYLSAHPNASDEEIAELLDPDLRELFLK